MNRKISLIASVLTILTVFSGCQSSGLSNIETVSSSTNFKVKTNQISISSVAKMETLQSKYSFDKTVKRLEEAITAKKMTIFSKIDHSVAAKQAGLSMQPATVLIFGNPKAGTPLMKKDPSFALQLPLKVLVTEVDGQVLVIFNTTEALIENTLIDYSEVENTLAGAEKLIAKTVTE